VQQRQFNNNLTERLLEVATQYGYLFDTQDFTFVTVRDRIRCFYNCFVYSQKRKGFRNLAHKEDNDRHRCDDGSIGHGPSRNGRSLGTPPTTHGFNPGLDNLDRGLRGANSTISASLSLNRTRYSQLPDATTSTQSGKDSFDWRQAGDDDEPGVSRVSLERQQDQQLRAPVTTPQGSEGRCQGRETHRTVGGDDTSGHLATTRARQNPAVELAGPKVSQVPSSNYRGARKLDPFEGHKNQSSQTNHRRVHVGGVHGQRRCVIIADGRIIVDEKNGAEPRAFYDFLRQDHNRTTRRVEDIFPVIAGGAGVYLNDGDDWRRRATKSGPETRVAENGNSLSQREDSRQRIMVRTSRFAQPSLQTTQRSLMPGGGGGSLGPVTTRLGENPGTANPASDRFSGDDAHSVAAAETGAIPQGFLAMVVKQCTPILNQRYQSCEHRRLAQGFLREGRWYHPTDADQSVEWWVHASLHRVHILMQQQALERTNPPKDHHENHSGPEDDQIADTTPNMVRSTEGPVNSTQHKSRPVQTDTASPNASLHESRRWDTPMTAFRLDSEASSHKQSKVGLDGGPCSVSPAPRLTASRSPFNFFQPPSFPADMVPPPALPVTEFPSRVAPSKALVQQCSMLHIVQPPSPQTMDRWN
jgi:hypothetical protein